MEVNRCVNCMCEISEGEKICHQCGYDFSKGKQVGNALRKNSILKGRYLVGNMLGQGGFGITYIGYDLELDIRVAIKEYYPAGVVMRDCTSSNELYWNYSAAGPGNQQSGIERFVQEARKMAKLDRIPSIVRVRDSFRENKTAYIVMDFVEGVTLKEYLLKHGVMDYSSSVKMLRPIMESLSHIHRAGLIHRDISPDNIMIQTDGAVRLLDMGAAVDMKIDHGGASMTVAKNGFSAPEQYMENGKLGSWTDVYAMCATIYYCLSGKLPPEAMERMMKPELEVVSFAIAGDVPENAAACLQKGLDLKVENRVQTMDELCNGLTVPEPAPVPVPAADSVPVPFPLKKILLGICAVAVAGVVFLQLGKSGNTGKDAKSSVAIENLGSRIVDNSGSEVVDSSESGIADDDRYENRYTSGGYELILYCRDKEPIDEKLAVAIQDAYFKKYPQMLEDYGTCTEKTVTIYLEEAIENGVPAYTRGTEIHCLQSYLEENEENIDVLVHELFHVVQNGYPNSSSNELVPVLTEGLADYARAKYGDYPNGVWSLPDYSKEQSYMDSFGVTAAFLVWLSDHFDSSITVKLNAVLHSDQYTDLFWNETTDYSIDELWEMYGKDS